VARITENKAVAQSDIEIWFVDETRIGQKNKIRRWARRGTRPSAPHDQRTASTYIFGYLRRDSPMEGKGAALVLPPCNTEAMNPHLAEIATEVAPGQHAICCLIRSAGICRAAWSCHPTSRSSHCRRNVLAERMFIAPIDARVKA
jgi:hypothetical protein